MLIDKVPEAKPHVKNFEQLGFGMFVHFGLYSQLAKGEWAFSIHRLNMEEYKKLADTFDVKSMREIVLVAKSAGCKYICLTTRHHEGFSLYDTKGLCEFDVMSTPTGRDLIKEFVEECRKEDILPIFYHTTLDWYQKSFDEDFEGYLDYLYKSIEILCSNYGKIGGLWFDGNWAKSDADWKESRLYSMIRRLQPHAMIINNTGIHCKGQRGEIEIDAVTFERGMAEKLDQRGEEKYITGEMCETLCDHWGVADDINFKPVKQLIEELCHCRKVGANFLLNIGPNGDGSVSKIQQGIMECIGKWMKIYGLAIYNGRPYITFKDKKDFILKDVYDDKKAYLFCFDLGQSSGNENVSLSFEEKSANCYENIDHIIESISWLNNNKSVSFEQRNTTLKANIKGYPYGQSLCVRVAEIKFK